MRTTRNGLGRERNVYQERPGSGSRKGQLGRRLGGQARRSQGVLVVFLPSDGAVAARSLRHI
jgi:hypothetical protein